MPEQAGWAGWKSAKKLTDLPISFASNANAGFEPLRLFSDMNSWAANGVGGYNRVTAPHASRWEAQSPYSCSRPSLSTQPGVSLVKSYSSARLGAI